MIGRSVGDGGLVEAVGGLVEAVGGLVEAVGGLVGGRGGGLGGGRGGGRGGGLVGGLGIVLVGLSTAPPAIHELLVVQVRVVVEHSCYGPLRNIFRNAARRKLPKRPAAVGGQRSAVSA